MIIIHDTGCYLGVTNLKDANKVIMDNVETLYKLTRINENPCLVLFNPLEPEKIIYPNENAVNKNLIIDYQIFQDVALMKTRANAINIWLDTAKKNNNNFVVVVPNISVLNSKLQGYCDLVMMSRNINNNKVITQAIANILKDGNINV